MKIKYLLLLGLWCFCINSYAQLTIPKKKCTRGKCYFVDQTNKRISDYYDNVKVFKEELAPVKLNGKWGFINQDMEIVIPISLERVGQFKDGLTYIKENGQFHLIDLKGESKSEKYDSIGVRKDFYVVKKGDKLGLLDTNGMIVEPLRFDEISIFYKGDFGVKLDGKWANYNNGNLDFNNPIIYYSQPEVQPVFSKSCVNTENAEMRNACSQKKLLEAIFQNIRYPKEARTKGIEGTVVIRFNIKKDGNIEDPEIVKNVGGGCGDEALNVVKTYVRKWAKPGMENGEPVNTVYNLPVKFRLE